MIVNPGYQNIEFGAYRMDLVRGQLSCAGEPIRLRRKAWQVLRYLAERPGILVPFDELFGVAWPATAVTSKVLTNVIGELREALLDDARVPRIIETVHRRGYRFVASVAPGQRRSGEPGALTVVEPDRRKAAVALPRGPGPSGVAARTITAELPAPPPIFVGRDAEIEALLGAWQAAVLGRRQIAFVTGDPGIGKTAVLDTFVHRLHADGRGQTFVHGHGQSIERVGAPEPYRPVLLIFDQLASGSERARALLRRFAPTWLVQIPWLSRAEDLQALREALAGSGSARMLREGCAFLEAVSEETPLLLVLEDLQWSDPATVEFLMSLAHGRARARLLLLATYRPAEALARGHPIIAAAHTLRQRRQSLDVALKPLPWSATQTFLERRFAGKEIAAQLTALVERHTAGNPLFLVAMTDHLVERGWVAMRGQEWVLTADVQTLDVGLPDQLREVIDAQLAALPPEHVEVLEAASVVGSEFATQAVAAALERPLEEVEQFCERLARRGHLLRWIGVSAWPDQSIGQRYKFNHASYQRVLYEGIAPPRRQRLHHRVAERLERGHGQQVGEIAGELAAAFVEAREPEAAARAFEMAAASVARRFAYREAAEALGSAIEQMHRLPESPERARHEGRLQLQLGNALMAAANSGDARVLDAFSRAESLCQRADAPRELFRARLGLCMVHLVRGENGEARAHGAQLVQMAAGLPTLSAAAHTYAAAPMIIAGEFATAWAHLERAKAADREPGIPAFIDLEVLAGVLQGLVLTYLGFLAQGRASVERALARSRAIGSPYDRVQALCLATAVFALHREARLAGEACDEAVALARENGLRSFLTACLIHQHAAGGGSPEDIQRLIDERHGFGEYWDDSRFLAILAERQAGRGDIEGASRCLDHAFARVQAGERMHEAEIHRLTGELLLVGRAGRTGAGEPSRAMLFGADPTEAEAHFRRSIDVAKAQQAKLLELRGAVSLGRLLQRRGETVAARHLLGDTYGWFREGFGAADLQEARALLEELGG